MNSATPAGATSQRRRDAAWRAALWPRVRKLFWLKVVGVTAFVWLFFIAYFQLLRYPSAPVTEMPLTALDRQIGFQPLALGPYLSLWLYVSIAPGLMANLRQLVVYCLWVAALCATGLGLFYFWPTAVPAHILHQSSVDLLRGIDAAGNACPSLHVATATFSAVWIAYILRTVQAPPALRALNALWFVAITYSTLAIKQHVLLDVLAGLALGLAFAGLSQRWWPSETIARRGRIS